jgi:hypothetical protein
MGREQIAVSQLTMKGLNVISHTRRGFRFITFRRSAVGFLLTGRLDRRAYNDLSGRHDHFQSLGHVAKIFSREKQTLRCNDYAVFRFHGRSVVGLATSIFFTRRKAPRSIMSGVESSSRSRSVRSWVDQNSSSCSHESNLGMARNFFPILLSLPGGQVHSGHQKIASFSMELQDDFEERASVALMTTTLTGFFLCLNRIARRCMSASSISYCETRCFSHIFSSMNVLTMSRLSHKLLIY